MKYHLVIDYNNFAMRAKSKDPGLSNRDGIGTGVVYTMLKMLKSMAERFKSASIILVEDSGLDRNRLEFYPEYKRDRRDKKKERTEEEQELYAEFVRQRERFLLYAGKCGIKHLKVKYKEADDLIACLGHIANHSKPFTYKGNLQHKIVVVSTDRDYVHMVSPCIDLWSPLKDTYYTYDDIDPNLELFKKSMEGDPGDGISGIPGVGTGTIEKAFEDFGWKGKKYDHTLPEALDDFIVDRKEFYELCKSHKSARVKKIFEGKDIVERNIRLISLRYREGFVSELGCEAVKEIKAALFGNNPDVDLDSILKLAYEDGFKSIYGRVHNYFAWTKNLQSL